MNISFEPSSKLFHLTNNRISYVIQINPVGYLVHLYWGKAVAQFRNSNPAFFYDRGFSPAVRTENAAYSLDTLPQEYPAYGNGDYHSPAYQIEDRTGSTLCDLRYLSHQILHGKPKLTNLPAVYAEAEEEALTLQILLQDGLTGLEATLSYTIFKDYDAITRSVEFHNKGNSDLKLHRAASMSMDIRESDFDVITLYGSHANERNLQRNPLQHGTFLVDSARGASSHQYSPFLALARRSATEDFGDVYGFSLVYSGNFAAQVQLDQTDSTRVTMGINPFGFTWLLKPEETFQTPETVLVYSDSGLNGMSQVFHHLYRDRLARGKFKKALRPILINNWEATYFTFDDKKIYDIATAAKDLGIELFVLDDGWFGHRNNDKSSLGDWYVNEPKFPFGLESLIQRITALGLQFGIWFEPEMVSEDSDLFRAHPDWCLHVEGRPRTQSRNQLVLDLSRPEVCDYIINSVSAILKDYDITYVKWDMNRHLTEVYSQTLPSERQQETSHRFILGLYHVLETLTTRFPDVLFESCSGGGGRFDAGMLYYMPQVWTSDNTDAVCRQKIQYGTSLVFPPVTMGAHVSVVPNHQVGRFTPLSTRGACAMSGTFGYELDITKLSKKEQDEIKEQVAFYKDIRPVIQYGDFYRILSPFEGNNTAWNFVSPDKKQVVAMYFNILAQPACPLQVLRLKGLDPNALYRVRSTGELFGGDELMFVGLSLPVQKDYKDFSSIVWVLDQVE